MKSTLITISILCIVWIVCSGGAASVYQNSLADWYRGGMDMTSKHTTRMIQSLEQATSTEQPPSEISIISTEGFPVNSRIIDKDGSVSDASGMLSVSSPTSIGLDIDNAGSVDHKIIQVLPNSSIIISTDSTEVMQVSQSEPRLQIYYGYQTDSSHPYTYFYKVDKIEDGKDCQTVKVDFESKSMRIGRSDCSVIVALMLSDKIPDWETLP